MVSGGDAAAGEILAGAGGLGRRLRYLLEVLGGGLVDVEELARRPASRASSGELNSRLGSGMPDFVATARTASGKLDVVELHDEGEDVALSSWQPKQ